jgi:glycosyltransferase involved in cell wall biosynthesis
LLIVGPGLNNAGILRSHPKIIFVGQRPHKEVPSWLQSFDLALIPYNDAEFNRFRSPMRLFDYLASGCPIVSTSNCEQIREFEDYIRIARNLDEFLSLVVDALRIPDSDKKRSERIEIAKAHTWIQRMKEFFNLISMENK